MIATLLFYFLIFNCVAIPFTIFVFYFNEKIKQFIIAAKKEIEARNAPSFLF